MLVLLCFPARLGVTSCADRPLCRGLFLCSALEALARVGREAECAGLSPALSEEGLTQLEAPRPTEEGSLPETSTPRAAGDAQAFPELGRSLFPCFLYA